MNDQLYGTFRNVKFTQIYPDYQSFKKYYDDNPLKVDVDDKAIEMTYYLLYSKYGNSTIASSDINRFQFRMHTIMFSYTPSWYRRLKLQKQVREMTDAELTTSDMSIINHALNPSTEPGTAQMKELPYIDEQNVTHHKRSKLEAYALLNELLATDVTEFYLEQFKKLFITILQPENDILYSEDENC